MKNSIVSLWEFLIGTLLNIYQKMKKTYLVLGVECD